MPVVDLPIEQLQLYTGTNPCPDDFDEFWTKRIQEAQEVPLQYEMKESEITGYQACPYYDLTFIGITGAK